MSRPIEANGDDEGTPLTAEERSGLIPTHIALRRELNELEQGNITEAMGWALARKRNVLREAFLKGLHRRMFNRVWQWAGEYRTSERNLGVQSYRIQPDILQIIDDARYWIDRQAYTFDEIAVRFHHRLVFVHPFPNGNGRWSRLAADLLIIRRGGVPFTWGRASLASIGDVRRAYVDALQAADKHDMAPLVGFARS